MSDLFQAFNGRILHVGWDTDQFMRSCFPELDLQSEYRSMDAWLFANPRKRPKQSGTRRFLVNWLKREKKRQPLYDEAKREAMVGVGPEAIGGEALKYKGPTPEVLRLRQLREQREHEDFVRRHTKSKSGGGAA